MVKWALRRPTTTIGRYQLFWFAVGAGMCLVLLAIGGGYALAGDGATAYPPAFRLIRQIPGGMRTHGLVMSIAALGNLFGLGAISRGYSLIPWLAVRVFSITILAYSAWCAYAFAAASILARHYNAGLWWYVLLVILSGALVSLPPPFRGQPSRPLCRDCPRGQGDECA